MMITTRRNFLQIKDSDMSLTFKNINKNCREASLGNHHYSIEGNYHCGYDVFYAYGAEKPPNGANWKLIGNDNSLGKGEQSARRHFRKLNTKKKPHNDRAR